MPFRNLILYGHITFVAVVQNKLPILMEVIQLFATQIELVSQSQRGMVLHVDAAESLGTPCCKNRGGSANVSPVSVNPHLIEAEYGEPACSFIMKHRGAAHGSTSYVQQCQHVTKLATRRLLITHFSLTLIWHLLLYGCFFKLACTQGSTLPVSIKSWHNSLRQTWQGTRKIT